MADSASTASQIAHDEAMAEAMDIDTECEVFGVDEAMAEASDATPPWEDAVAGVTGEPPIESTYWQFLPSVVANHIIPVGGLWDMDELPIHGRSRYSCDSYDAQPMLRLGPRSARAEDLEPWLLIGNQRGRGFYLLKPTRPLPLNAKSYNVWIG